MKARFFKSPAEFRKWLDRYHESRDELVVGYFKIKTGKPSMTWSESVDQALCYGWIDGIRRRIDEDRYCIRFTPRRRGSNWSAVNIRKVAELTKKGLMQEAGLAAYARRAVQDASAATDSTAAVALPQAFEQRLAANKEAHAFFSAQAPSYRRQVRGWIMSAKREATRRARLQKLIDKSAASERVY